MTVDLQQTLTVLRRSPGVWNFAGQLAEQTSKSTYGICDASAIAASRQNAEPLRFDTGYLEMSVDADGNLVMAAGTEVTLFTKGVGDTDSVVGTKGDTDTDAYDTGALVKQGQVYWILALGAQFITPFTYDSDGDIKTYSQWVEVYAPRIIKAFWDNTAMSYTFKDDDCKGTLTKPKFWPEHASMQGQNQVYNGAAMGPPSVTPLRRPIISGGRESSNKVAMTIKTGKEFVVEKDGTFPIPDGIEKLVVPIEVLLYGQPECAIQCFQCIIGPNGQPQILPANG